MLSISTHAKATEVTHIASATTHMVLHQLAIASMTAASIMIQKTLMPIS